MKMKLLVIVLLCLVSFVVAKEERYRLLTSKGELVVLLTRNDDRILRLAEKAIRHEIWSRESVASGLLSPRESSDIDPDAASILDEYNWKVDDEVVFDPEPDSRTKVLEWQEWAIRNHKMNARPGTGRSRRETGPPETETYPVLRGVEKTGKTRAPDGTTPQRTSTTEWKVEKNPDAGNAEADWHWVEYKINAKD